MATVRCPGGSLFATAAVLYTGGTEEMTVTAGDLLTTASTTADNTSNNKSSSSGNNTKIRSTTTEGGSGAGSDTVGAHKDSGVAAAVLQHLKAHGLESACPLPFALQFDHIPSAFVEASVWLDTQQLTPAQRLHLPLYLG